MGLVYDEVLEIFELAEGVEISGFDENLLGCVNFLLLISRWESPGLLLHINCSSESGSSSKVMLKAPKFLLLKNTFINISSLLSNGTSNSLRDVMSARLAIK